MVYKAFDRDGSGSIDYDEFVRGVRGEMNQFRKKIALAAFKRIDRDGSGILDINDIKGVYNAKMHPDVKSGKKSEDEILGEFLETFEAHHAMSGAGTRDRNVTPDEFVEYYNNVSASIDNDQYFELMMINAWKLHGEATRKPAYAAVIKKDIYSEGFSVTQSAPFGVDKTRTDYATSLRPGNQPPPA
jgi:Ca2+-binding EF-hand superfamily protein